MRPARLKGCMFIFLFIFIYADISNGGTTTGSDKLYNDTGINTAAETIGRGMWITPSRSFEITDIDFLNGLTATEFTLKNETGTTIAGWSITPADGLHDIKLNITAGQNYSLVVDAGSYNKAYESGWSIGLTTDVCRWVAVYNNGVYSESTLLSSFHSINWSYTSADPYSESWSYAGYKNYSTINYTRDLAYNFSYNCTAGNSGSVALVHNGINVNYDALVCNDTNNTVSGTYKHTAEGPFNIWFSFNSTNNGTSIYGNNSYYWDLYNPEAILTTNVSDEGFNEDDINITLICRDNVSPISFYNISYNSNDIMKDWFTNNTAQSNITNLVSGQNIIYGECSDYFGTTEANDSLSYYHKNLILIDEQTGAAFDVSNLSIARIYWDSNSSFYDLKGNGTNTVNITSVNNTQVRLELGYYGTSDIVTRHVDLSIADSPIRLCANTDDVTHYEQLVVSATQRPVKLKSLFADCLVAADDTRFAYQDSYVVKAYTINGIYYVYTYSAGVSSYLASLDGSISTYINVDTIEFSQTAYNINVLTDALSVKKSETYADTIELHYQNLDDDNTKSIISIENAETNAVVFAATETSTPNNYTVLFSYATLNITNTTLWKVTVTNTKTDGDTESFIKWFNPSGNPGYLNPKIAAALAIALLVFGFNFTIARTTFSWFGVLCCLSAAGVLVLSPLTWYNQILLATSLILMVFTVLYMVGQNYPTVTS